MRRLANNLTKGQVTKAIIRYEANVRRTKDDLRDKGNEAQDAEAEYYECMDKLDVQQKFLRALKSKLKKLNTKR